MTIANIAPKKDHAGYDRPLLS
jgi:hypothetical protein